MTELRGCAFRVYSLDCQVSCGYGMRTDNLGEIGRGDHAEKAAVLVAAGYRPLAPVRRLVALGLSEPGNDARANGRYSAF